MMLKKRPEVNLKLKYRKAFEAALVISLSIHIVFFHIFPPIDVYPDQIRAKHIEIKVEDIPATEQIKKPPPPPRPSIPIPSENEKIPEDLTIESTELVPTELPPPPPPDKGLYDSYVFIPYDERPEVIGGYRVIQNLLRYPNIAKKAGIQARVVIGVLIDENGNTVKTQVLKESDKNLGFEEAAQEALMKVKWKPALQRDCPVKVWVAFPVIFTLK